MKLKIKVRELTEGCLPKVSSKGDWIDLKAACDMQLNAAQAGVQYQKENVKYRDVKTPVYYIPLGIAMQLPKGFEAIVTSRSSSPKKLGIFIPNGEGIIDNCYRGNDDQWHFIASPIVKTTVHKGDRICQFRIQLSQKATVWQKLKWLFSNGIKIEKVEKLSNSNRGGFGTSGVR